MANGPAQTRVRSSTRMSLRIPLSDPVSSIVACNAGAGFKPAPTSLTCSIRSDVCSPSRGARLNVWVRHAHLEWHGRVLEQPGVRVIDLFEQLPVGKLPVLRALRRRSSSGDAGSDHVPAASSNTSARVLSFIQSMRMESISSACSRLSINVSNRGSSSNSARPSIGKQNVSHCPSVETANAT